MDYYGHGQNLLHRNINLDNPLDRLTTSSSLFVLHPHNLWCGWHPRLLLARMGAGGEIIIRRESSRCWSLAPSDLPSVSRRTWNIRAGARPVVRPCGGYDLGQIDRRKWRMSRSPKHDAQWTIPAMRIFIRNCVQWSRCCFGWFCTFDCRHL